MKKVWRRAHRLLGRGFPSPGVRSTGRSSPCHLVPGIVAWLRLAGPCLALLPACGPGAPPAPTLAEAAGKATFGTVEQLGSHVLQSTLQKTLTREGGPSNEISETTEIRWKDKDHWEFKRGRSGRLQTHLLVQDAVAYAQEGGALARQGDAEPFRVMLAEAWDPWRLSLDAFAERIALGPEGIEIVEGRRAEKNRLSLLPAPEKARPTTWTPTTLEGSVWLDEALAVRILGDVHLVATSKYETLDLALRFSVSGIGEDPGLTPAPTP